MLWRCHGESLAAVGGKLASGLNFEVFGRNPKKVGKNFEVEIFFFSFLAILDHFKHFGKKKFFL